MLSFITNAMAAISWNNTSYFITNRRSSSEARNALKEIHSASQAGFSKGIHQISLTARNYAAVGDEFTSAGSKVYNFFFRSQDNAYKNRSALHQMAHDIEKACPGNSTLLKNFKKEYAFKLLTASPVTPQDFTNFLNRHLPQGSTLDDFFSDQNKIEGNTNSKGASNPTKIIPFEIDTK